MSIRHRSASFDWQDPLLLEQALTDDERMVRESARSCSGRMKNAGAAGVEITSIMKRNSCGVLRA